MKNINQIPDNYLEEFSKTDLGKKLIADGYNLIQNYPASQRHTYIPPREWAMHKWFPVDSFYYIDLLLKKKPSVIYDIGCGDNNIKTFLPKFKVIGIDPINKLADINDHFDADYAQNHEEQFDSVMAICSLHFIPLENFSSMLKDVYTTLKRKSRAYVSFNIPRMVEKTSPDYLEKFKFETTPSGAPTKDALVNLDTYIRNCLTALNYNFISVDVDFEKYQYDGSIDGNIRLVFEK